MTTVFDDLSGVATIMAILEQMIDDPSKRQPEALEQASRIVASFSEDYKGVGAQLTFILTWLEQMTINPGMDVSLYIDFLHCAQLKNLRTETLIPLTSEIIQQKLDVAIFKTRREYGLTTEMPNMECAHCLQYQRKTRKCSACRIFFYCNTECQAAHWSVHKRDCMAIRLSSHAEIID